MLKPTFVYAQTYSWDVTLRGIPPSPGATVQLSTTAPSAFDIFPSSVTVFGNNQGSFFTDFEPSFSGTVGVGAYYDSGSYAAIQQFGTPGRFPLAITQVGMVNAQGRVKLKFKTFSGHNLMPPGPAYLTYQPAAAFAPPSGNINPPSVYITGPSGFVTVQLAANLYAGSRVAVGCVYQGGTSAAIVHN
jgi:hypothetical protein